MNRDLKMKIVEIIRCSVISVAAVILLASCSRVASPANTDPLPGQEAGSEAAKPTEHLLTTPSFQVQSEDVDGTLTAEAGTTQTAEVTTTPIPTATETEIPTSMPALEDDSGSYEIVGEIFQNPQLKEDLENVIVSPSPIDSPEEYAEWKKELNEILQEELHSYQDRVIQLGVNKSRIGFEDKSIGLPTGDWLAVSAYKFGWNGEEVLTKVFPVSMNGEIVFFHVTYSADDSMFYNQEDEPFKVGKDVSPRLFCAPGPDRHVFRNEMLREYTDEQFDSLRRVLAETASEEDMMIVSEMEFVLHKISIQ